MATKHGNGESETLAIPARMRLAVDDRDQGYCRFCGRYAGPQRALHHVRYGGDYQGMGGRRRHATDNLVTVGWLFEHDCHSILHARKNFWLPYVDLVIANPGTTVLQHLRWEEARKRRGMVNR